MSAETTGWPEARKKVAVSFFENVVRRRFLELFDRLDAPLREHNADVHGVAVASLEAVTAEMRAYAETVRR